MSDRTSGYIKLHRVLLDHPKYSDSEYLHVWIHLLLTATYKPREVDWCGKTITLQPGQLITGRKALAKATGVNENKIWRILDRMKTEQQIEQQAGNLSSIITIVNWAEYQETEQPIEQQSNSNRTAIEQPPNTNKNVRKKEYIPPENTSYSPPPIGGDDETQLSPFQTFLKHNWPIPIPNISRWESSLKTAYPNLDLVIEAGRALAWIESNPKRKPESFKRFFGNWMSTEYEKWRKSDSARQAYPPLSRDSSGTPIVPEKKGHVVQIGGQQSGELKL